jgi:hypothetical protein
VTCDASLNKKKRQPSADSRDVGKKIHKRRRDLPAIPPALQQRKIKRAAAPPFFA